VVVRQANIVKGRIFQIFQFFICQGADARDRGATPEVAAFQDLFGGYQGAGCQEGSRLDNRTVQYPGAYADQAAVMDLTAVQYDLMTDGDTVVNGQGGAAWEESAVVGDMQNTAILDIRLGADADLMDIASYHRHGPDGRACTDLNVTYHQGGWIDPGAGSYEGLLALVCAYVGHGIPRDGVVFGWL